MTIDDMLSKVADIVRSDDVTEGGQTLKQEQPIVQKSAGDMKDESKVSVNTIDVAPRVAVNSDLNLKKSVPLKLAKEISYCIEKGAEQMGLNVVTAICNESGRLVLLEAMDDSFIASIQAAQDKAYTAVALKMPTHKALEESRGGSLDGFTNGGGILMLGGGFPLYCGGYIIGGVGVSGGTKEQDMLLAQIGTEYLKKRIETL